MASGHVLSSNPLDDPAIFFLFAFLENRVAKPPFDPDPDPDPDDRRDSLDQNPGASSLASSSLAPGASPGADATSIPWCLHTL